MSVFPIFFLTVSATIANFSTGGTQTQRLQGLSTITAGVVGLDDFPASSLRKDAVRAVNHHIQHALVEGKAILERLELDRAPSEPVVAVVLSSFDFSDCAGT